MCPDQRGHTLRAFCIDAWEGSHEEALFTRLSWLVLRMLGWIVESIENRCRFVERGLLGQINVGRLKVQRS